ncbi:MULTISPECIES: hypothetical protein [Parabacteroides]|uniref:hypothetical protein n=1 Tax=Parabacteroides leei TaxID=2939491 RepID=UPI00189BEA51|nr:hypothetical protein [Parabacteroides goldsteinii]
MTKVQDSRFKAPHTLGEGLAQTLEFEFIHNASEGITFKIEENIRTLRERGKIERIGNTKSGHWKILD